MEAGTDQNWQLREETPPPTLIDAHLAARRGKSEPAAPVPVQQIDSDRQKIVASNY